MTCNDNLTRAGMDQPTQHFQRGGFARPIRPKKSHHLSRGNAEADVTHGVHITVSPAHEVFQGSR